MSYRPMYLGHVNIYVRDAEHHECEEAFHPNHPHAGAR